MGDLWATYGIDREMTAKNREEVRKGLRRFREKEKMDGAIILGYAIFIVGSMKRKAYLCGVLQITERKQLCKRQDNRR